VIASFRGCVAFSPERAVLLADAPVVAQRTAFALKAQPLDEPHQCAVVGADHGFDRCGRSASKP